MNVITFTAAQRKELELQALIFNHLVLGIPIPPLLSMLFRRSILLMNSVPLSPSVKFDRKVDDSEPWRSRRTDGKKWRCSKRKVASHDHVSKYCERHMHRGRKCSRNHLDSTASNFPIGFSIENTGAAEDRPEDDKADRHCFVMGIDLSLEKPTKAENEKEEKPCVYLFNKCVENKQDCAKALQLSISIP